MHLRNTYTLRGKSYTPRSAALLQREGTLVVSDTDGVVHCYDLLSGELVSESDLSKHGGSILCSVAGDSPKLVVTGSNCLGARQPYRGGLQLGTVLQTPSQPKDSVVIQIFATEIPLLLTELKSRRLNSILDPVCKELIGQLEVYQSLHKADCYDKWSHCSLRGSLNQLTDVFDSLVAKYKPVAGRRSEPIPASPPVAPVLSAIRLRLLLLNSKNIHTLSLENGSQSITNTDVSMMYCEGVRRVSFEKWPHKNYIWSVPRALAEAGMYLVPANSSNPSLAQFKGDRTSCFLCGIHVYRWEPTDEPWSEHTRHSSTCPLMKGKFNINVPATVTESTHPAVCCTRPIKCVSSAANCRLVATATKEGIVQVWDLERALYIIEHARLDLQKELSEGVQPVSFTDGNEVEQWKKVDKDSDDQLAAAVDVSSLCLVSYDSRHAPAAASASSTSTPPSPALLCGCTIQREDRLFPALAIFSLKPKSPSSKSRADTAKTVKPINYDGYDDFFYEPLLEPFPDMYTPPPPLPADIDLPPTIKLPTPPSLPSSRSLNGKSLPVLQANADLQLVLHLDMKPTTGQMVPRVSQLLPIQGNHVVMNLVWRCEAEEGESGCLALLTVEEKGTASVVSKTAIDMLTYEREADIIQHMCSFPSSLQKNSHLLAAVTRSGSVRVLLVPGFVVLTEYQPASGCGQYVHCTPGAGLDQLTMTTTLGEVHMLCLEEKSTALENETVKEKVKDLVEPITVDELHLLHELMSNDHVGVSCHAQSPSHWEELSPLQYYCQYPRHMLQPQESLADSRRGELFTTKIWQYVPQWKTDIRGEHLFQINTHLAPSPPTTVKIKLTFATADCINQLATVSLYRLNSPSHKGDSGHLDEQPIDHICGPISIKQFIDVTRHSLQLSLTHPSLILSRSTAPLLLSFQSLFVDDYLVVTEEAVKATSEPTKSDSKASPHRMRHSMRSRLMRRAPVTKTNIVVHSSLHVTVFTQAKGSTSPSLPPQLRNVFSEELVTQLILLSCDYSVEEREYVSLSEPVKKMVMDVTSKVRDEDRIKALEALCWLSSASFCDADRISFQAVTTAICRLLTSLLFSCVCLGSRETAQWCGRLVITLARDWCDDERTGFTDNLCSSLLQLLPLLQLTRSAASLHWVLRLVAFFSSSSPSTSQRAATACFTLLLKLARQVEQRRSSDSLTEVLQTEYQQEGSVLEPDLFDIYLSYYPKPSSKVSTSSSSTTSPSVYLSTSDNSDFLDEFVDITYQSTPVVTGIPPTLKSYSQAVTSATVGGGHHASSSSSSSAHSASRSSYTIYDSELLLLLRGSSGQDPFTSSAKEYNAFKHGSFLLYSQRGLLETLPLSYSCMCVSAGVTVKETGSVTGTGDSGHDGVSRGAVPTSSATKERCPTSGYSFPSPSSSSFRRTPDSVEPLSSPISPLIDSPKELMMHVDDLKPGCSYSAVLEFPQLIALTDISIQSSSQMFAVSIDVWAGKEDEEVRVAQCLALSEKSLMLGNLSPPPICQYARVTYLGRLSASHEKAIVSLGSYYGYPVVSPSPSVAQLDAVEESLLSQYYHAREKLEELLLPQSRKPTEQQVTNAYQNCFAAQVKLARFRHQANRLQTKDSCRLPVYSLGTKLAECEVITSPLKKLYKIVGCLVDALLILTREIHTSSRQLLVQREECVSLFTAFCVNGPPKLHARPCALLVCLCGSQPWWGQFVASSFSELYSSTQVAVFEKERVLLQFSALCQCTTACSDIIPMLLKLMAEQLSSLTTSSSSVDVSLLEWLSLLLAHILASITIKEEEGNGSLSLFAPSISLPSSDPAAELKAELDQKLEKLLRLSRKIKKRAEGKEGRKILPSKLSYLGDVSPLEIQAEIDRKVKKVQEVKRKLQKKLSEAKGDRRVELERKLTALSWSRLQKRVEVATGEGDDGDESPTRTSLCLCSQLVNRVTRGLTQLMVKLIEDGKLSVVPIIAKALLLLLDHMEHPPSLSSLLSSSQLHQLILTTCRSHHHHGNKQDYLWSCRAVHNLFLHMLAFEKGTTEEKEIEEEAPDLDQEGDSITPGSDTPVEEPVPASDTPSLVPIPPLLLPRFKYPRPKAPSPEPAATPEPDTVKPKHVIILSPSDPGYQQQLSHGSFIISAATDQRLSSSVHFTAELQLQIMIGRVYESLLRSIQFALPLPCEGSSDPAMEQESLLDEDKALYQTAPREQCSDDSSTQVLLSALEKVFLESADTPQICSSLDLPSLLQLWHNAASLLTRRVKKLSWLESASSSSPLPPAPHSLFSAQTCSLLLDRLMSSPAGCSTLSHLGFSLLHCHLLLSKQERRGKGVVVADINRLVQVLVRYCSLREEGEVEEVKEKNSETVFVKFLSAIAGVLIVSEESGPSYLGVHVLMMALEKLLQIREESALSNPNFLSLINVLVKQRNIALLFSDDCPSAHSVSLIQSCTTNIINLLIESLSPAHKPLVTSYGAVMDGDRSRRLYYTSSSAQELKWAELKLEQTTPTNLPLSELVQLVKKLLVINIPETSQEELYSLLRSPDKSSPIPLFSSSGEPLLGLVYTNIALLTALLQGLNMGTEEGQTGSPAQVLLSNLVSFLVSSCKDLSCFTAPVLAVLAAAGEQGKTVQSKFFLDLLGQFTVAKGKKEGQRQLLKFIDQGGGEVVLKCLVNSSQLPQATPTGHTLSQAISNLGQQQVMKPYKETSDLINFIPSASIKASPSRTSLKDLQSSTLKDTPGRGSSFHHTFQSGEQTLKLTISLPQPILMHSLHIYQPVGLTQNGPSSVVMEVSPVVRAGSSVPLSLPVKTTGLTGIRMELQTPMVSQEVVVHLYRPVVTDSLSLSHMLLLGTPYGSLSQPSSSSTSSSTKRTSSAHPSEGWLDIVSSWLEQGPKVTRSLSLIASSSPGLVSGCVSLYGESLSHTAAAQLSKFFLTISRHSPDTGRHLLQHLLKAVVSSPGAAFDTAVTSRHVELLHSLCLPTHKLSQERLSAALKMLPQLLSPSSAGESLAPLIRALASSVWRGRTLSHSYQLDLGEDIFKSLLDTALGLDVGSTLKSAINSLLAALCRYSRLWYLFVTAAADSALSPTTLQEVSDSGRVLHTLAQVSQSDECIDILLSSSLISSIVSNIHATTTKLLDPSPSITIRTALARLCLHFSFLTDLCLGHKAVQQLLTTECTHIWQPLLQLLSETKTNLEISDAERSFCQDVAVQFFSACVNCSVVGKKQFISLLSKALRTSQKEEDGLGLTPFILTLLLNLVLSVETVSAVITLHPSITSTVTKPSSSSSLTSTHTSPSFHPSHPVGTSCYYLTAPVDTTLESIALLFHHEGSQRQPDKPPDQPKPRVLSSIPPHQLSLLRRKSHEVVFRKSGGFDVLNFDLSSWKWQEGPSDKVKLDVTFVSSTSGHSRTLYSMDSLIGRVATATPTKGCGHTTKLLTMRRTAVGDAARDSDYLSMTSLLEVFTQVGGVRDLALLLPSLYQSHWPPQYASSNSHPAGSTISLSADKLPPFLPPNSFVMLTLCLQLNGYADLLVTNISLARLLLRGLLGAISKEPLGSSTQDQVSLIPFILLHQLLKDSASPQLRQDLYQSGAIAHTLHCLQVAGHHQPRRRPPHTDNPPETVKLTDKKSTQQPPRLGKTVVSKRMSERQYWAKGTGFGTGSTSSSWDMTAMMAHQQSKELLVTLCLVIMAEYLKPECREEDALPTGLLDLLSSSCLLPALATCLMNDSILDISKHVQLYRAAVQLLDSLASHTVTKPLLVLHVHEEREEEGSQPAGSSAASIISLHSLLKKLKKIASTYSKAVSDSSSKDSPPSKLKTLEEDDGEEGDSNEKSMTCYYGELVYLTSSGETVVLPPSANSSSTVSININKNEQEDTQLSQLMEAILTTGDKVAAAVAELQAEPSSPQGLTQPLTLGDDTGSYVDAMRPLQFDSYSFTEETDDNHVHFRVPFHYSSRVEGVASSTSPARARRLAQEVASLSSSLPLTPNSSVFVRCDENRLDVMKVLITGPSDTPYANGCFEFDVLFPVEYPSSPMLVNLITTGHGSVRFNPNLYNDGKVCLSVLNTWHGRPEEKWNPHASSFLQVLVSIQSLILVPEPYFNEPGYEQQRGTPLGDQRSLAYNANIYIATIQWAMLNQIRNPSACFKQVVLKHFYLRRQEVLQQCDQWKRLMMETMQRLRAAGINVNSIAESFKTLLRLVETLKVELFKIKMSDFEPSDELAEPT